MTAYYTQLDKTETDGIVTARFIPNEPAQGAWNPHEQHMAPASGLLARELEQFSPLFQLNPQLYQSPNRVIKSAEWQ